MSDAELFDRHLAGMERFAQALVAGGDGWLVRFDGVLATVIPAAPDRSLFNAVMYSDPAGLVAALPRLADVYDQAGVRAWTVWVREGDAVARDALAAAGHVLDAAPRAMGRELPGVDPPPAGALTWERADGVGEVAALNDAAYGGGGQWIAGAAGLADPGLHLYLARVDGRPAACVGCLDHEGDAGVVMVATAETARRRGLATGLMRQALADAAQRRCRSTTLVATRAGAPVYARLGYRDLGGMEMWERRRVREG